MKQAKFNQNTQRVLAYAAVFGVLAIIAFLIWKGSLPSEVKDILLILITMLVGEVKTVYSFFFDGTAGQTKKDDDPPPATTVTAAADSKVTVEDGAK